VRRRNRHIQELSFRICCDHQLVNAKKAKTNIYLWRRKSETACTVKRADSLRLNIIHPQTQSAFFARLLRPCPSISEAWSPQEKKFIEARVFPTHQIPLQELDFLVGQSSKRYIQFHKKKL